MTETIHEIKLAALAKKLGITVKHGWKTALQKRLNQKNLTIITNWVARGVPDDFHHILENAGIGIKIWEEVLAGMEKSRVNNAKIEVVKAGSGSAATCEEAAAPPVNDIFRAVRLTEKIMKSGHPEIASALMKNLEQFAAAVDSADELSSCKRMLVQQDGEIKAMGVKIEELSRKIDYLTKDREGSEAGGA